MIEKIALSLTLLSGCGAAHVEPPTEPGDEADGPIAAAPRTEPVAGWQTYTSEEFGFAFDYPPELAPSESRGSETTAGALLFTVRVLGPEESDPAMREHAIGRFTVDVLSNPRKLAAREWLDAHGWPFGPGEGASESEVGGAPALDVTTGRMLAPNRFLYVSRNETMLRIAPTGIDAEGMLESFRFLP